MSEKHEKVYTDQIGNEIRLPDYPYRIISLVPSQTELLFDLGINNRIIGITKFCIHPVDEVKKKQKVGGTKKLHLKKIMRLDPDLIIGNKEENTKEDIDFLSEKYPVWVSDITTLKEAFWMMEELGKITGTTATAEGLINEIKEKFSKIEPLPPLKVLYLIWKEPLMAAGKNTFIDELLRICGFENAVSEPRYPEVKSIKPDLIFLSSEPYPFKEKHVKEFQQLFPDSKIILVDGEMFSWYGSRLKYFPDYVNSKFTDLRSSQNEG